MPVASVRWRVAGAVALVVITLAGYANSFPGSFIWDDWQAIPGNHVVTSADLWTILTTDYCGQPANCGTYRPLAVLSYAANWRLFGSGATSFHAVNVLLHTATTLALFLALGAMGFSGLLCWFAAAFFGLHPIHTEAVNIVIYRTEIMAALWVLVGLWAGLRRVPGHLGICALSYALALLSKENGVTLLLLLPIADAFKERDLRAALRNRGALYATLAVITALWLVVRHLVASSATVPPDIIYETDNPTGYLSLVPRILTSIKAQAFYLAKLVFPLRLQAIYTGASVGVVRSLFSPWGMGAVALAVVAVVAVVRGWAKRTPAGFGILFYLATFSVTANLLTPVSVLLGERFAYLPSAGFCIVAAAFLVRPLSSPGSRQRLVALALPAAWLVLLGGLLIWRNPDFRGDLSLAQAAVRCDPGNARAWFLLAGAQLKEGHVEEAETAFRTSIGRDPAFPDAYVALSHLLLRAGRPEEAIQAALQGLAAFPRGGISQAYLALAQAHARLGQPREALTWLDRAAPQYDTTGFFWGLRSQILESLGEMNGAVESARRVVELEKGPGADLRLADLLRRGGREQEAGVILRRAEALLREMLREREDPETLNQLGLALAWQGNYVPAGEVFRRASEIDPSSEMYRENLEEALRAAR